jgi:drug/metabolite transporter (DMT)-like permease
MAFEHAATWAAVLGAVAYGSGDFLGGFASRRLTASSAVAVAQAVAVAFLLRDFAFDGQFLALDRQGWLCVAAGLGYAMGVISIYEGLAHGRVAIVSSICGLLTIALPLAGDVALARDITTSELVGIAFCAAAAILIVSAGKECKERATVGWSLRAGVTSGIGFGVADVCLGMMPPESATAALVTTRCVAAAIAVVMAVLLATRLSPKPAGSELPVVSPGFAPASQAVPMPLLASSGLLLSIVLAAAAGLLDVLGHFGYVYAATRGSMGVAAALVAIFPGVTVLLAVILLRERITAVQLVGFACGASGIMFIV